jgi:hypothetical protein
VDHHVEISAQAISGPAWSPHSGKVGNCQIGVSVYSMADLRIDTARQRTAVLSRSCMHLA